MSFKLYNTLEREVEEFLPIEQGKAGIYACGPTVYNFAHIGNLRTYIFEDILRRSLEYCGFSVKHVMNITDVGHLTDDADEGEDKIEKSARESGRSVWEISEYYTRAFFTDIEKLNIEMPHFTCKATEHIDDMINLIKKLEEKGYTYSAGGNIYFSIDKFKDYGKMAFLDIDNLKAGARIQVDTNKRNPHDFVLWFTKSKFEKQAMLWDSPWGKGYPGWHIECSAMSMKYLGESFDIHCGGIDHINVHHTNEIAQSEAATGKKWVNYWLHGEFLVMNKSKMAKSAGNFITLSTLIEKGFDPLDYRYFCLSGHYRSQLQFSWESMETAGNGRNSLIDKILSIKEEAGKLENVQITDAGNKYIQAFKSNIEDDLNTPRALAVFWTMLKDSDLSSSEKLSIAMDFDRITGFNIEEKVLKTDKPLELEDSVIQLIEEREAARKSRDFTRADLLRDKIIEAGYEIKDTAQGAVLKKL